LRRLFAAQDADIVHARSRLPAWLAWHALGAKSSPRPHFVTTVHGLNSPGRYSGIMARGERVVCVSESVRAHVLRALAAARRPSACSVIERGIDPAHIRASRACARGGQRAAADARARHAPEGPRQRDRLLARVRAAGVDARCGCRRGRSRARAYLRGTARAGARARRASAAAPGRADRGHGRRLPRCRLVLQLSAKPESFGRTVVEALSSGAPVVGWDHGGVGELLARYFPRARAAGRRGALLGATLRALDGPRPRRSTRRRCSRCRPDPGVV
jgi:glycosyltransferase involved in cell wall biosynthesis